MRTTYDPEGDALYVRFTDGATTESDEIIDDVVFDFDADGRIVAIAFLNAKSRLSQGAV
jgi:uncharacterized protein YuzE